MRAGGSYDLPMTGRSRIRVLGELAPASSGWLLPIIAGLAAVTVVVLVGRPWLGPTNDPDSTNSVLYFERILAGHRLEVTVLTTPKPLLTFLYGATWELTGNWTPLVWETVAIHGLGVALATRLAVRLAGIPAGLFVAVALVLYPAELTEVLHANSLPYAVVGWSAAGLAATAERPRWLLVGVALLLAALTRVETLLILAMATIVIGILAIPFVRSRRGSAPTPLSMMPILVGWLAPPIQATHDLLLTGNAWYSWSVPTAYTELVLPGLRSVDPATFARGLFLRYEATPLLALLAILGFAYLLFRRRWAVALGVGAIGVGSLGLLGYLAWRGIYVSNRYYEGPTLAFVLLAAIGMGALIEFVSVPLLRRMVRPVATMWAFAAVFAVLAPLIGGIRASAIGAVARDASVLQASSRHFDEVAPRLSDVIATREPPAPAIGYGSGFLKTDLRRAVLFLPGPLLPKLAIETGSPLTRFGDLAVAFRFARPEAVLRSGQILYHDPLLDLPAATFRLFEIDRPTPFDGKEMIPIAAKPGSYWLVWIQ